MTDKLRDRIAAVLLPDLEYASAYNPGEDPRVWSYRLADAVIAELGLFIQYENGRVVYDTKPAACKSNGNWQQRIVGQFEPYTKEKDD